MAGKTALIKIYVFFFGQLKDVMGHPNESVAMPEGATVHDLLDHFARQTPGLKAMLPSMAIAVNQEYSKADRILREGDEVGLLPPVSGGSQSENPTEVSIIRERIDADLVMARLKRPQDGAVAVFDGIVRDNTRGRRTLYLDYEAYEAMALAQMQSLAAEACSRFAVRAVSIIHRLGRLEIGETSVLIVVASAHRAAAFDACRWIIDTLKKTVPIWKKEYFEDGAIWADGEPFPEEIRLSAGTASNPPAS